MNDYRVGLGVDAHALEEGVALVLGGVEIDHPSGLAGHSDGDVLAHALTDAILGAAGLEDIGALFPSGDPRFAPHRDEMRFRLAAVLDAEPAQVAVRATTTDRLGFTGRGEGLAAQAVALLRKV
jgi:2C-methyl-D-erythritol 2,4-cyclodiphosphate synthase